MPYFLPSHSPSSSLSFTQVVFLLTFLSIRLFHSSIIATAASSSPFFPFLTAAVLLLRNIFNVGSFRSVAERRLFSLTQ